MSTVKSNIHKIREHIWGERGATLFVGSGLSLNADKIGSDGPQMKIWSALHKQMYWELYPEKAKTEESPRDDALKTAEQYEANLGRDKLDEFLKREIPDGNYAPGVLHTKLLDMPWKEVFTTNYDTLLERAAKKASTYSYSTVLVDSDIPNTLPPRITKLHGSFPAQKPFIITEEDFRKYPQEFKPFVNMVQQSLMEYAFCLIGFSGDDPNFKKWTGWVRDNLGGSAPEIYLIGVLDLDIVSRQTLEQQNVIPVDLAELFPKEKFSDSASCHKAALEWLILSLKQESFALNWPYPNASDTVKPNYYSVDDFPEADLQKDRLKQPKFGFRSDSNYLAKDLLAEWQESRKYYPGWIIAPASNRGNLWVELQSFLMPSTEYSVLNKLQDLELKDQLLLAEQLNWRLELCLCPLFQQHENSFCEILEKINPLPDQINLPNAILIPSERKDLDWIQLSQAWVSLALAICRVSREELNSQTFNLWFERLRPLCQQNKEWLSAWHHELCQFYLLRHNQEKTLEALDDWPINLNVAEFEMRRVGILAELDQIEKAWELGVKVLNFIRLQTGKNYNQVYFNSIKYYLIRILESFKIPFEGLQIVGDGISNEAYEEALNIGLTKPRLNYNCNPSAEFNTLIVELEKTSTTFNPNSEVVENEQFGFDPYTINYSMTLKQNSDSFQKSLLSFKLPRLIESSGCATKIMGFGCVTQIDTAAKLMWFYSHMQSVGFYLRSNDNSFGDWLSRVRVTTFSEFEITEFSSILKNSISSCLNIVEAYERPHLTYSGRVLPNLFEFASRICFRFSVEQLDELWIIITRVYENPNILKLLDSVRKQEFSHFVKRYIANYGNKDINRVFQKILDLQVHYVEGVELPNLALHILNHKALPTFQNKEGFLEKRGGLIADLEKDLFSDIENTYLDSVTKLSIFKKIGLLSDIQQKNFLQSIWNSLDKDTLLPKSINLFWLFTISGESNEYDAEVINEYLLKNPLGRKLKFARRSSSEYFSNWLTIYKHVEIDSEQLENLIDELVIWFDRNLSKNDYKKTQLSILMDETPQDLKIVEQIIADIIIPNKNCISDTRKNALFEYLTKLENRGYDITLGLLYKLALSSKKPTVTEVTKEIKHRLYSDSYTTANAILGSIDKWVFLSAHDSLPKMPYTIVNELIEKLVFRRPPSLVKTIELLSKLLHERPEIIEQTDLESLKKALEFLIRDTKLPNRYELSLRQNTTFSESELPHALRASTELAIHLKKYFVHRNLSVPEIIREWEEIARTSILPEVKSIF